MKRIVTIQHTQSIHHTNGMVGSWTDWDLSELGVRQAEWIGNKLGAEIDGKDWLLYASDLRRARHTAEIIGRPLNLTPILTPALRERNLGRAVGKSVQWLRENMEREERTIDDRMFPDAESTRDLWNRLEPFLEEILEGPHQDFLIVSHGNALSVLYALWLNLPVEALNHCALHGLPGGVSFLQEGRGGMRTIRRLSDMSYMTP